MKLLPSDFSQNKTLSRNSKAWWNSTFLTSPMTAASPNQEKTPQASHKTADIGMRLSNSSFDILLSLWIRNFQICPLYRTFCHWLSLCASSHLFSLLAFCKNTFLAATSLSSPLLKRRLMVKCVPCCWMVPRCWASTSMDSHYPLRKWPLSTAVTLNIICLGGLSQTCMHVTVPSEE